MFAVNLSPQKPATVFRHALDQGRNTADPYTRACIRTRARALLTFKRRYFRHTDSDYRTPLMRWVSLLVLLALVALAAEKEIAGSFTGDWSGSSGASGAFRLTVAPAPEEGKPACTVTFSFAGQEVKTKITSFHIDGAKISAQYEFDLQGNRLQSTIDGELTGERLQGKYRTKALADGTQVDEGVWKATLTK